MIEMHQGDEPIGDDDYAYLPPKAGFVSVVFSAPALAIASLGIALADMTIVRVADSIGEVRLYRAASVSSSQLTGIRASTGVQLALAFIALVLGAASYRAIHPELDKDDEEAEFALPGDPLWVRALSGAAIIVATVVTLLCAAGLVYALISHTGPLFDNNG